MSLAVAAAAPASGPLVFGVPLKYVSLLVLTVQNSMLVLVMRYSRVASNVQFYASTAVLMSELAKFAICLAIVARASASEHGRLSLRRIYADVLGGDCWKMLIPAGLYTIQNNLQYTAVSLLDAATFQVTYQLKILTTALCAVAMLGTQLSRARWVALVVLTAGVVLVQLPPTAANDNGPPDASFSLQFLGLLAVVIACVLSGLAGVYFEKVLKGSRKSLWTRNVQLSLFSTAPALLGVLAVDGQQIRHTGFFYGYSWWTCGAIACQALGGIVVALVVKYADNILKGFATSISIILSCLASIWLFDFHITPTFISGTALVIYATYMYSRQESALPKTPTLSALSSSETPSNIRDAQDDGDAIAIVDIERGKQIK
ncbi:UDP-galactose transporter Gms1 [Coemansia sp. RSA 2611]|nr:UDP-galactose transporter Gms1 [Coemansia sp. RSA 2705]KAJ2320699.1 UDP-galactose transporter Gms1 [Coemansia sp. RSA 2704]KAJ2391561.1 UDP-galactose transporter Gms1 [Coemansia sp. RSA 2611]